MSMNLYDMKRCVTVLMIALAIVAFTLAVSIFGCSKGEPLKPKIEIRSIETLPPHARRNKTVTTKFESMAAQDDVQPVPFIGGKDKADDTIGKIIGGEKEKGLKPIDTPKFDLPSPIFLAGSLIHYAIKIVWFVLQVVIVAVVAWAIVRAVNRKRNTGTVIPAKGEKTLFDMFDSAVSELKARRADREKDLTEINKRLPAHVKTKAKK